MRLSALAADPAKAVQAVHFADFAPTFTTLIF